MAILMAIVVVIVISIIVSVSISVAIAIATYVCSIISSHPVFSHIIVAVQHRPDRLIMGLLLVVTYF